jgi:predicted HTH domain antitoxin
MSIVTEELLDKELKAILKAGGYGSKKAVVGHALEVLLAANPTLRLAMAVELYRGGEVTLSRASEIGGLDVESFKDHLAEKGVERIVEVAREEIIEGTNRIRKYRG